MNINKNVTWVITAGAMLIGGLQGQENSETPQGGITRAEVEAFVYSLKAWTKESKSEAELARMQVHREYVVSLLKEWVEDYQPGKRPKTMDERRPVENAIYWLGELGTDAEVPFLEGLIYADQELQGFQQRYKAYTVTRALIAIDTELSNKAVFRALDRMTNKYRRYAVLTTLKESSRSEVADQLMAIMASDHDIGMQLGAFQSAVKILDRVGRRDERDDLIRQALAHADESVVLNAAACAAEYGVVACLPALRELPVQRPGMKESSLKRLETDRRVLEAVASDHPNEAYLGLLSEDLERFGPVYFRVMERLTPEPGVADKLRRIHDDNQAKFRHAPALQYHLLENIQRLGGALTEEERKRWPKLEEAAPPSQAPHRDEGGDVPADPQRPRGDDDHPGKGHDNSPPPGKNKKGE